MNALLRPTRRSLAPRLVVALTAVGLSGCFLDATDVGDDSSDTGPSDGPILLANNTADGQIFVSGGSYTWLPSGESSSGYAGEYPDDSEYAAYFRFELPFVIPEGATILEVRLEIHGAPVWQWQSDTDALKVAMQDDADAPEVDQAAVYPYDSNPDAVALLPTQVRWPETGGLSWDESDWNQSPNLAELVQLLVDTNDGIDHGAHLQFWITKTELSASAPSQVGFVEYSQNPAFAATLSLTFEP